jgi:arginase
VAHAPQHILAQLRPPPAHIDRLTVSGVGAPAAIGAVARAAERAVEAGLRPLVIGGDHTVAVGAIAGVRTALRRRADATVPLFVLWLDAHADANTAETSPSGNMHGMALAGVVGAGPLALTEPLPAAHVTLAGARVFDPGELAFLRRRPGLRQWDVSVLRGDGWRAPAAALLDHVRAAGGWLYVSLDLDVFDPRHAPGVGVPQRHGAYPTPTLALLRALAESGVLAGADVVELYPPADRDGRTARLAAAALAAIDAGWRAAHRPQGAAA